MPIRNLTTTQLAQAHTAFSKIKEGAQMCQAGFEDLLESKFFEGVDDEVNRIKGQIQVFSNMSRSMALSKGDMLKVMMALDENNGPAMPDPR